MLVDQQNGNVLALGGEAIERCLDGAVFRLGVDDEEVLLRVWGLSNVLRAVNSVACKSSTTLWELTPTPASSMPVTVSCQALASTTLSVCDYRRYLIANNGKKLPVFVCRGRG